MYLAQEQSVPKNHKKPLIFKFNLMSKPLKINLKQGVHIQIKGVAGLKSSQPEIN